MIALEALQIGRQNIAHEVILQSSEGLSFVIIPRLINFEWYSTDIDSRVESSIQ